MLFQTKFAALLGFAASAVFAMPDFPGGICTSPLIRKEWRTLTTAEKSSYINAVKCLHTKPGVLAGHPSHDGVTTRYEDFLSEHKLQTPLIHWVGHFLAWHRLMIVRYEKALREECAYNGAQPYWDWSLDALRSNFTESPIFDPVTGFGTNGRWDPDEPHLGPGLTGGGCIYNGPFKDWRIGVMPGAATGMQDPKGCIARDISPIFPQMHLRPDQVAAVNSQETFWDFELYVNGRSMNPEEFGMHIGGHASINGNMSNPYTSPTDPLFYMHHTNLDRVWWNWQKHDSSYRLFETGGTLGPRVMETYNGPPIPGNSTLTTPISLGFLGGDQYSVMAGQVHDIQGRNRKVPGLHPSIKGILCYDYADPPTQ
ncbi:Di-copper centre-containing protein [Ascobolus immersus RN42]|uniref:Di-copper centre-containing protein n=1 Tax=Ascobolus immersus RN42 TaxID=1160509 RepID=A0A3N4HXW2_ASCIM|nr:Di-copper centre-containing protein [Ascobolus immersus RN42]